MRPSSPTPGKNPWPRRMHQPYIRRRCFSIFRRVPWHFPEIRPPRHRNGNQAQLSFELLMLSVELHEIALSPIRRDPGKCPS